MRLLWGHYGVITQQDQVSWDAHFGKLDCVITLCDTKRSSCIPGASEAASQTGAGNNRRNPSSCEKGFNMIDFITARN